MNTKDWENAKRLYYGDIEEYEAALELMHKLFRKEYFEALDDVKELSDKEITTCYSNAFLATVNNLKQKKCSFGEEASLLFRRKIEELFFDKRMRHKLDLDDFPITSILSECRKKFKSIAYDKEIMQNLSSREKEEIFDAAFDSFKNVLTKKNYKKRTLQSYFFTRFSDSVNMFHLIRFGNKDKKWRAFVEDLEVTKGGFLSKFEALRNGRGGISIHDIFIDAIFVLEENIKAKKFRGESAIKTYFNQIFFNKIVDFLKKEQTAALPIVEVEEKEDFNYASSNSNLEQNSFEQEDFINNLRKSLEQAVAQLGGKCKKLILFAAQQLSHYSAMKNLGMKNESQASSAKNNCMNKLKMSLPDWKGNNQNILDVLILFHDGDL